MDFIPSDPITFTEPCFHLRGYKDVEVVPVALIDEIHPLYPVSMLSLCMKPFTELLLDTKLFVQAVQVNSDTSIYISRNHF